MTRTAITTAIMVVLATLTISQVRADGTFSKGFAGIGGSSVAPAGPTTVAPTVPAGPKRLSPADLKTVLSQLGYETKPIDERIVEITVKRDTWTMPVTIEMTKSGKKLWFSIRLTTLKGDMSQHANRILKLMSLGGSFGPEFFSVFEKSHRVVLFSCRENENLTNAEIKGILEHMSLVAVETAPVWDPAKAAPPAKHVGTWQFNNGNLTISVNLDANGGFRLQNSSGVDQSGTYSIENGKLVLTSGSERLELPLQWTDSNHMSLTLNGQAIPFTRA